jgi:hypothetical protein
MFINYDENEIGDLDGEEIEGYIELNSKVVLQHANKYQQKIKNVSII